MNESIINLKDAVRDFVSSLSVCEQDVVRRLILSSQVKSSLNWYVIVIKRYLEGPASELLIQDIIKKYADEAVWRDLDSSKNLPLFEAEIILRESQTALGPEIAI